MEICHNFMKGYQQSDTVGGVDGWIDCRTVSEMADFEVPVQADHGHSDEAPTTEEEARPAIETAALPAEQPAVGQTRYNEKGLSCHCKDTHEARKRRERSETETERKMMWRRSMKKRTMGRGRMKSGRKEMENTKSVSFFQRKVSHKKYFNDEKKTENKVTVNQLLQYL